MIDALSDTGQERGAEPTAHAGEGARWRGAARLNILLLCDQCARHIGTVEDHIQAFLTRSRHNVLALDARGGASIDLDLDRFDVVVTHYSVAIGYPGHVPASLAAKISAFSGTKIAFLQDEYRWIDCISRSDPRSWDQCAVHRH